MKKYFFILCLVVFLFFIFQLFQKKTTGDLVLIGGGKMPPGIFQWVANRKPKGKILIVSNDGTISHKWDELYLIGEVIEVIFPEGLTIAKLKGVGALFIDGGNQHEHLRRLNAAVIQSAHEQGILVLGTSAGAMILGEFYFSAKYGGVTSEEAVANPNKVVIESNFVKIEVLKKTIIDSHFSERARQERLRIFIEQANKEGLYKGIGIDESTALCIKDDLYSEVIGLGGVHFVIKTTQGNSCISLYQGDTSNKTHSYEHLDQK